MFCSECGSKNIRGAVFCANCGTKFDQKESNSISIRGKSKGPVQINTGIITNTSVQTVINNKKIKVGIIIFAGALVLVGAFFFFNSNGGGMPIGRYYMHDGQNFMDELIDDPLLASMMNLMVFEFSGRGRGLQHLPGVSVPFRYTVEGNRLRITIDGVTLSYTTSNDRESFSDSFGIARFVRRR